MLERYFKKSSESFGSIMPIRRKSSIYKKYYESIGQGLLFGHDNLNFKTVNLPKKQRNFFKLFVSSSSSGSKRE